MLCAAVMAVCAKYGFVADSLGINAQMLVASILQRSVCWCLTHAILPIVACHRTSGRIASNVLLSCSACAHGAFSVPSCMA